MLLHEALWPYGPSGECPGSPDSSKYNRVRVIGVKAVMHPLLDSLCVTEYPRDIMETSHE
jgi:hypothetical protein